MLRHAIIISCTLALASTAAADEESLRQVNSIGVYSIVKKGDAAPHKVSVFLAGYLENEKGYAAYNLDQYFVRSETEARARALELGAEAVLVVKVEGFEEYQNSAKAKFRLIDAQRGKKLKSWSAKLRAPYFDPPAYRHIEPYGNLEEVFRELPTKSHEVSRYIKVLVLSDQQLDGPGEVTRRYLESQLAIASRTLSREFGIALEVKRIETWAAPAIDIFGVAEVATSVPGRDDVDLTLVCLGPPMPARSQVVGYARVLTNIVVNRQMNAHVFVHEIGHVLGAIHIAQEGCVMEPVMRTYRLAERFQVLPPILFSDTNKRIINLTKSLSLCTENAPHEGKIAQLLGIYEELRADRLREVAPYYGDLLLSLGRNDEAVEVLRAGQKVDPNNAAIRYSLRQALVESGLYGEAQQLLQEDFDLRRSSLQRESKGRKTLQDFALMRVTPSVAPLGSVHLGFTANRRITIASLGTLPLELSTISLAGTFFTLAGGTPSRSVIEPGESLSIEVEYRPSAAGNHTAFLQIGSNDLYEELKEVRLTGQVID